MSALRVAVVEVHALVRTGLRAALAGAGFEVCAETGDGNAAAAVVLAARPDVAIVDLGLPGKDGIDVTRELKADEKPPRVVILTMREREDEVLAALAAGAEAFCVKSSGPDVLLNAVRTVAAGGAYFDPRVAHVVLRRLGEVPGQGRSPLTPRETEVLKLIAEGRSNVEIAGSLYMSLSTVKTHVSEIIRKLGSSDRVHAAVTAFRRGIIS